VQKLSTSAAVQRKVKDEGGRELQLAGLGKVKRSLIEIQPKAPKM
jgi:hypothetical protein